MELDRRGFVAACAALAAAGTGCIDDGNGDGNGEPAELPDYTRWMPEPREGGVESFGFFFVAPSAVPDAARPAEEDAVMVGLDEFDEFDGYAEVQDEGGAARIHDYADEEKFETEVDERVDREDESEEVGEYDLYEVNGGYVAVNDEDRTVIGAAEREKVEGVVETVEGDAETYAALNDALGEVVRRAGDGHSVEIGPEGFSGEATVGARVKTGHDDGTVDMVAAEIYEDEDAVDADGFENALESQGEFVEEVEVDGRVAVARGSSGVGIVV